MNLRYITIFFFISLYSHAQVYVVAKDTVYYYDTSIEGADPESFDFFTENHAFAKDKNHIFYQGIKTTYDCASFGISRNEGYIFDKNDVYYRKGNDSEFRSMESQSPLGFKNIASSDIAIDKERIYWNYIPLENSDPKTLQFLEEKRYNSTLYRDKNQVYYKDKILPLHISTLKIIKGVDYRNDSIIRFLGSDNTLCNTNGNCFKMNIKTFKDVSDNYIKDSSTVRYGYYNQKIIKAHAPTFEVPFADTIPRFSRDRNIDYYDDNALPIRTPKWALKDRNTFSKHIKTIENKIKSAFQEKTKTPIQHTPIEDTTALTVLYTFPKSENTTIKKGKWIYMNGTPQYNIDTASFEIFNNDYAKDKNNVYLIYEYKNHITFNPIPDIDLTTFTILKETDRYNSYCKDTNAVYKGLKKLDIDDPKSFTLIDNHIGEDKHHIYIHGQKVISVPKKKGAAIQNLGKEYYKYGATIFYKDDDNGKETILKNGDPKQLRILTDEYALHKNKVCYKGVAITNLQNYEIIAQHLKKDTDFLEDVVFIKGKAFTKEDIELMSLETAIADEYDAIYYNDSQLYYKSHCIGKDINHLYELGISNYFSDGTHIYYDINDYHDMTMIPAEGVTLADLETTYTYTHKNYYLVFKTNIAAFKGVLLNIDTDTFEELGNKYAKDKDHVYYNGLKIQGAHAKSFKTYNTQYAKDKEHVYYEGKKIESIDGKSFEVYDSHYSRDQNHVYYDNEKTGLDPATFRLFKNYGFDHSYFYYQGKKTLRSSIQF